MNPDVEGVQTVFIGFGTQTNKKGSDGRTNANVGQMIKEKFVQVHPTCHGTCRRSKHPQTELARKLDGSVSAAILAFDSKIRPLGYPRRPAISRMLSRLRKKLEQVDQAIKTLEKSAPGSSEL